MIRWEFLLLLFSLVVAGAGCSVASNLWRLSSDERPKWEVVWEDNFDGDALDRSKWRPEVSCWGGGNNERQCYTDRIENVKVENGVLKLISKPETFTAKMFPDGMKGSPGVDRTQRYTSGKVRTRGLASWRYGRISARIKLPSGLGTWPAFWMMPADDFYGDWPLSGEIDIMEAVNLGAKCADCSGGIFDRTSGALHFGGLPPNNTYLYQEYSESSELGPWQEWRVYSLEWGAGLIQWFVDGKLFLQISSNMWYTDSGVGTSRPYAPFDQPFYLMLNLAVGGNLAEKNGGGFDPKAFPAEMLVDWVRVEQCNGDAETGLKCMTETLFRDPVKGPWES